MNTSTIANPFPRKNQTSGPSKTAMGILVRFYTIIFEGILFSQDLKSSMISRREKVAPVLLTTAIRGENYYEKIKFNVTLDQLLFAHKLSKRKKGRNSRVLNNDCVNTFFPKSNFFCLYEQVIQNVIGRKFASQSYEHLYIQMQRRIVQPGGLPSKNGSNESARSWKKLKLQSNPSSIMMDRKKLSQTAPLRLQLTTILHLEFPATCGVTKTAQGLQSILFPFSRTDQVQLMMITIQTSTRQDLDITCK